MPQITRVEYIINPSLIERYEAHKSSLKVQSGVEERLMFHGTSAASAELIVRNGFEIGGHGVPVAHGAVHGRGIYTSDDPTFAMSKSS